MSELREFAFETDTVFGLADQLSQQQYPNQASNSKRDLTNTDERSDAGSLAERDRRRHTRGDDNMGRISRQNSDYTSQDYLDQSIAEAVDYPSYSRAVSVVDNFDNEGMTASPVISDIDDRYSYPRKYGQARQGPEQVPARRSSIQPTSDPARRSQQPRRGIVSPDTTSERDVAVGDRSSGDSAFSHDTAATSVNNLPALQTSGPENGDAQALEPVLEDDPKSWDLVGPEDEKSSPTGVYALETRAEKLLDSQHLRTIFNDPKLLLQFTGFLNTHRPKSIAILIYYLDALKALRAIGYANAIAEALDPIRGHYFTQHVVEPTKNSRLEQKAEEAFGLLVRDDLPAFIAHTWTQVVSVSIQRRIVGTLAPHLREASEGLAEVFCLSDPSRTDNPIVFASEEFVRTTQYGMGYAIGRNCRFLQGPKTNPNSVRRLKEATMNAREHTEVMINYRRDGSPFMNLLMIAPLMDSRGNVRYYIGAQVDVSNLVKECSNMDGLLRMIEREQDPEGAAEEDGANRKDEFQELSEMFNGAELDTVHKFGGRMHKAYVDDSDRESISHGKRRVLLKDPTQDVLDKHGASSVNSSVHSIPAAVKEKMNGRLQGVYEHYLLIRPAPSLRILFTSPSLRVPGILQSPFINRIGGSSRVRADLQAALGEGRGVTAKIRWLTRADADGEGEGRPRWIHCTPLFGHTGAVGVWMIVLVDEEGSVTGGTGRRFRNAPPVSSNIGGKQWEGQPNDADRRRTNGYAVDSERRGGGARNDALRADYTAAGASRRPSNTGSARSGNQGPTNHGDVSEFSFQLGQ